MDTGLENNGQPPVPTKYLDYMGFWEGLDEEKLNIQKCGSCGTFCHPPQPICPDCRTIDRTWEAVSGKGRVYSWVTYQDSPHPGFKAPYTVVLVELDEGVRMVSRMVDVNPDDIETGMTVRVTFQKVTDEMVLPLFKKI